MSSSNRIALLPALLAAAAATALAVSALLPEAALAPHFALIDHDDSVHPLSSGELSGVRLALALLATCAASLAAALWAKRRSLAQFVISASLRPPASLPFALILVAALAVRLALLDGPMRFDESDTFDYFASRSFFNILTDYTAPNNHILHTFCVRISYLLFGDSPQSIRMTALLAGMLLLPLTFLLARRLFDERAGYFAMAFAAAHPALIYYSTNARGYTLVAVFTVTAFLAASFFREQRSWGAWLAFVAAGALGSFTIPTMLYPLAAASVWALWTAPAARRIALAAEITAAALLIGAATVAFYAPAAARTGVESLVANRYVQPLGWDEIVRRLPIRAAANWRLWTSHLPTPILLAAGAALATGLIRRESRRLAFSLALTAVALMAIQRVLPYSRVFSYAAPIACVIAGAGLAWLTQRRPKVSLALAPALAVVASALFYFDYRWNPRRGEIENRELGALARRLLDEAPPGVGVFGVHPLSEPIRYEFFTNGRPRNQVLAPTIGTGIVPGLDAWPELILVRPVVPRPRPPGFWIDLGDPALQAFHEVETIHRGPYLEAIRLKR